LCGSAWGAGPTVEGRQPDPAASVACWGSGRDGPAIGGEDRRHGPADAARLGPSLQRLGTEGLIDNWTEGPKPRLSEERLAEFTRIVDAGPDHERDGVVRWRRIDLKRVIAERFGVDFHPRYVGKLLHKLGSSHITQGRVIRRRTSGSSRRLKKFPARAEGSSRWVAGDDARRDMV
jgi:transposase